MGLFAARFVEVAASRKAIQALRLCLRLGLRQSGSALARGDYGTAEAVLLQRGGSLV